MYPKQKKPIIQKARSRKLLAGFTLVELLISVSIFSLAIVVTIGALLNLTDANEKSQAILTAMDNLNAGVEQMARILREGDTYNCGGTLISSGESDCTNGANSISFLDQSGQRTVYRYQEIDGVGRLMRDKETPTETTTFPITAPEINITELTFFVLGSSPSDNLQPRVLILIDGETVITGLKADEQSSFTLQTTVSQRTPDFR